MASLKKSANERLFADNLKQVLLCMGVCSEQLNLLLSARREMSSITHTLRGLKSSVAH